MKLYPFPKPQLHLRRRATSKGSPEIYWDHHTHVVRWMGRNALRRIHEFRKTAGRYPTVDELQDWLTDHCSEARRYFDDYDEMAEDAAAFALDAFDPLEYEVRVKRARNGGKVSGYKKGARGKRPPKYTTDELRKIEHLSIAQQAEELGCSPATIKRIRARLKAEIAAEHETELDALFGPQEGTEAPVEAVEQPDDDALLAALQPEGGSATFLEMSADAVPLATPERITLMEHTDISAHAPIDWDALASRMRQEDEARVTFAAFDSIEVLT